MAFQIQGFQDKYKNRISQTPFKTTSVMLKVSDYIKIGNRDFVVGENLSNGEELKISLSDRRSYSGRPTLEDRKADVKKGGVILFQDCVRAGFNKLESSSSDIVRESPKSKGAGFVDVMACLSSPYIAEIDESELNKAEHKDMVNSPATVEMNGKWYRCSQKIVLADVNESFKINNRKGAIRGIKKALNVETPGRAGFIIRGQEGEQLIAIRGFRRWDSETQENVGIEESIDFFLNNQTQTSGVNVNVSGNEFLDLVEESKEIVWEIIPTKTLTTGPYSAVNAALEKGYDKLKNFRYEEGGLATGFIKCNISVAIGKGEYVKSLAPTVSGQSPIPVSHLKTNLIKPDFVYKEETEVKENDSKQENTKKSSSRKDKSPLSKETSLDKEVSDAPSNDKGSPSNDGFNLHEFNEVDLSALDKEMDALDKTSSAELMKF